MCGSLGIGGFVAAVAVTVHGVGSADETEPRLVFARGAPSQGATPTASPSRARSGPQTSAPRTAPQDSYEVWAATLSRTTGVPARALAAYAVAQRDLATERPTCGLSWPTLAGIGYVESGNGLAGGGLLPSGRPREPIIGVALSGLAAVASVPDSDDGRYDRDRAVDRAVGPLQFLPSTWRAWHADGDRDNVDDPQDIDDASLAAARYLCASGDLSTAAGWSTAVRSYNHSDTYVTAVLAATNAFAERSNSGT